MTQQPEAHRSVRWRGIATALISSGISVVLWTACSTRHEQPSVARAEDVVERKGSPAPTSGPVSASAAEHPGFYEDEAGLTPSERAGREVWYKATGGNARFHTYTFQQRIGVLIDWYRVLNSQDRLDRFAAWGLINDPGCCTPGTEGCPAKSLDETYGFDWCPGDAELLKYVGREGYRDPACDFKDAPDSVDGKQKDQRQSSCDLAFGTSTGALGFRKFPNPRFDKQRWLASNGSLASWDGFRKPLASSVHESDARVSHLADGSIEPPLLVGISCGSCHISFDPLEPPSDPARPEWKNIKGGVGNQYSRISEILASGMPDASLEYQMFAHARPGTTDTSAIPTDQTTNPGSMNAIINTSQRPQFTGEDVEKWRKVAACDANENGTTCWCEPERDGKCWRKSRAAETVHHILKGGEDSIGANEAVQRVYLNIGSCAEACWVNHLTDLRQLDPNARNYGQTPFDIGQCRRDCPNFRAIEDRLPNIVDFFLSKDNDATDLYAARANERKAKEEPSAAYEYADFVQELNGQFGKNAVARGRDLFATQCARCHSSISEDAGGRFETRDFHALDPDTGRRADWLSNENATLASEVGTNKCRSLHSNHMSGHVWEEYGSARLRARPADPSIRERSDGGRGYYRNLSLLSLWAHAPFMHNNAIGPEICGKPSRATNSFYRSPYVDEAGKPAANPPACLEYDPSVAGRFALFVRSAEELLTPEDQRPRKITTFDVDVPLPMGLRTVVGGQEKQLFGFTIEVPKGTPAAALGGFQYKTFVNDLVLARLKPDALDAKLTAQMGAEGAKSMRKALEEVSSQMLKQPEALIALIHKHPEIVDAYTSCRADLENRGHRFGTDLPDADKQALIAFLATL
jgi:hypothetical protein